MNKNYKFSTVYVHKNVWMYSDVSRNTGRLVLKTNRSFDDTLQSNRVFTPHVHARAGSYVIGAGVHYMYVYICMYICDIQECLNGTLAVNSPLQTLAVDFSSNL